MNRLPAKKSGCGNLVTAVLSRHKGDNLMVDEVAEEAGTYFGLSEKFAGKKQPLKNIRIPDKAFESCKKAFNSTGRIEYIDVLNAAITLVEKVEPDSRELAILINEKEAIMASVDVNTKAQTPAEKFKEMFEAWILNPSERPEDCISYHSSMTGEDLEAIDWFLDSHENVRLVGVYTRAYSRFLSDTLLDKASSEQRSEIIKKGWLYYFIKWASVAIAAIPNAVIAIWKWILSMRGQWEQAETLSDKAIMIGKNLIGWELAKCMYVGVIGCHLESNLSNTSDPVSAIKSAMAN